jgi:hypothetical protein
MDARVPQGRSRIDRSRSARAVERVLESSAVIQLDPVHGRENGSEGVPENTVQHGVLELDVFAS